MYGQISVPGGLGLTVGADGTADKKSQAKLEALLKGLNPQMDIQGNAATADKLKVPFELSLTGDVTGKAEIDGSGAVRLETKNSQLAALWAQADRAAFSQIGLLIRERKAGNKGVFKDRSLYIDPFLDSAGLTVTTGSFLTGKIMA